MASFQIQQDFEKENPHKNVALAGFAKKEQLLTTKQAFGIEMVSAGVGGSKQAALQQANKLAFREVGNVNAQNENIPNGVAAVKKPTLQVEQFQAFSVYEDAADEKPKTVAAAMPVFFDKENIFTQAAAAAKVATTNVPSVRLDQLSKQTNESYEVALDNTPMSVSASDVLSPMSVDNSMSANDESVDKTENLKQPKSVPINDRQRFFEVVEYQRDILDYFHESEVRKYVYYELRKAKPSDLPLKRNGRKKKKNLRPKYNYMRRQTDINNSMRTILVDWLVEVAEEYNLDTETLYLSVAYVDRFLSQMSVVRSKLQLVGTAAMYIASKYEEIYPPDVGEYVFITDDTYTKAQVLRMEQIILKILSFDLCTPTAFAFINTYSVLCDMSDEVKHLTLYISELSLLHADPFLRFLPSIISSAALALARYLLKNNIWSPELEEITKYRLEDLKEVFLALCDAHNGAPNLAQQAMVEKYKSDRYSHVANVKPLQINTVIFDEIVADYNASPEGKSNIIGETSSQKNSGNVRRMISAMLN